MAVGRSGEPKPVRKLRLVRPDVAVVDLDLRISGVPLPPEASDGSGGEVRASLMLVLVEQDDRWWITAHDNVLQSAGDKNNGPRENGE